MTGGGEGGEEDWGEWGEELPPAKKQNSKLRLWTAVCDEGGGEVAW